MKAVAVTGAVLLGGASKRYGRDKALAIHLGVSMGERMIATVRAAGIAEVVTIGGPDRGFAPPHWPDLHPGEGPLGGLLTVFAHSATPLVALVACDLPDLTSTTLRRLIKRAIAEPATDAVVARTDRREPLCAVYRTERTSIIAAEIFADGTRSLQEFLACLKVREVVLEDFTEVRNINRPEDHLT